MALIIKPDEERSFNPVTIRIDIREDYEQFMRELKEALEYGNLLMLDELLEALKKHM